MTNPHDQPNAPGPEPRPAAGNFSQRPDFHVLFAIVPIAIVLALTVLSTRNIIHDSWLSRRSGEEKDEVQEYFAAEERHLAAAIQQVRLHCAGSDIGIWDGVREEHDLQGGLPQARLAYDAYPCRIYAFGSQPPSTPWVLQRNVQRAAFVNMLRQSGNAGAFERVSRTAAWSLLRRRADREPVL